MRTWDMSRMTYSLEVEQVQLLYLHDLYYALHKMPLLHSKK